MRLRHECYERYDLFDDLLDDLFDDLFVYTSRDDDAMSVRVPHSRRDEGHEGEKDDAWIHDSFIHSFSTTTMRDDERD